MLLLLEVVVVRSLRVVSLLLLGAGVLGVACATASDPGVFVLPGTGKDAGTNKDTSVSPIPDEETGELPDTGTTEDPDTSSGPADTKTSGPDTAKPPIDSGGGPVDTAVPPTDTYTPPPDGDPVAPPAPPTGKAGKLCTSDLDCDTSFLTDWYCSNGIFTAGTLNPTPVCVNTFCTPGTGTTINACDSGAGVCLPVTGGGICMGACSFGAGSAAPLGCKGKNTCNPYGWGKGTSGALEGVGYCFGGCTADADCTGGDKCQKEEGICKKTLVTYTKKLGDACTSTDATAPAKCNCYYATASGKGYCTQACRVGDTTASCPTGYTCDAALPKKDSSGATVFVGTPKGLGGECLKDCTTDADCTAINGYCDESAGIGKKTCHIGVKP